MPSGTARAAAVALAHELAGLPQACLRSDRASLYAQWDLPLADALRVETEFGIETLPPRPRRSTGPAARFAGGAGRHGVAAN